MKKIEVVGHWRIYPDGRRVWVKPYKKKVAARERR